MIVRLRSVLLSFAALSFALGIFYPSLVQAATTATTTATTATTSTACKAQGVLVSGCVDNLSFAQYLTAILNEIMPFALFIAMVMIAASGVQYMFGGLNPEQSKKAKQRIIGIVIGALMFFSINLIINQLIAGGVNLNPPVQPTLTPTVTSPPSPNPSH